MASKVRFADGRELSVALPARKVINALAEDRSRGGFALTRVTTLAGHRVWINGVHVAAVEDRPDMD